MTDTIGAYDDFAVNFAEDSFNWTPFDLIEDFSTLLKPESKILDIGCGGGRDAKELRNKGFKVVGLDASKELVIYAQNRFPDIKFVVGNMLKLPLPSDCFDGVWCHIVILHLETIKDVNSSLKEMYRVLKLGGVVHLYTKGYVSGPETVVNAFFDKSRFFRYFKLDKLTDLLKKNKFQIIKAEQTEESIIRPNGRQGVFWIRILAKKY
ncbi:MAG: class I SAM-dependent methyltransferase [Candidatus Shapirobacteria bacterium]